jgi:hypothetical protein
MTSPLITNRYNQVTPTSIQENGTAISVPFYISPTADQAKQLLNAFRNVKQRQLLELGFETTKTVGFSGISVETATTPPTTPIEQEMGITEDNLRHLLFSRQGIQERVAIKLMRLTGVYLITRQQIEETQKQWLDQLFGDEQSATSRATEITPTKKRTKKEASSEVCVPA